MRPLSVNSNGAGPGKLVFGPSDREYDKWTISGLSSWPFVSRRMYFLSMFTQELVERHPAHERACDAMPSNDYQSSTIFDGAVRHFSFMSDTKALKVMLAYSRTYSCSSPGSREFESVMIALLGDDDDGLESVSVFRPSFLLQIC